VHGYRIEGGDVLIYPPSSADSYRLIYVRSAPKLTLTDPAPDGYANTIDGYNGWEELLVLYALLRAKRSQDEPTGGIENEIIRQISRVDWAADGRDASEPMSIQDLGDSDPNWGRF